MDEAFVIKYFGIQKKCFSCGHGACRNFPSTAVYFKLRNKKDSNFWLEKLVHNHTFKFTFSKENMKLNMKSTLDDVIGNLCSLKGFL